MKTTTMLATAAAALALVTAGCGGGPEDDAAAAQKTREDAMLAFAKCMRENGIDMPDPQPGSGGGGFVVRADHGDREKFEQANEACAHHMEDAMGSISEEDRQRFQDRALEFARCMRKNGVDVPDPTFDGKGAVREAIRGNPQSKRFREAEEKCRGEGPPMLGFEVGKG